MTEGIGKEKSGVAETDNDKKQKAQEVGPNEAELLEPEFLKNLPPEARKVVEIGLSMQSMHRLGPMPNPLTEKLTEKHIDKILEISAKDDELSFEDAAQSRKFTLIYIVIFAVLFVFLTIFLVVADKDLYTRLWPFWLSPRELTA